MELQITGTNMEISPAVRAHVERKFSRLDRHLPNIIESRVEISEEKTKAPEQRYLVRATVAGGTSGAVFHGEERGEDLIKAVDGLTAVMIRQLDHHKGKMYEKGRGNSPLRNGRALAPETPKTHRKVVKTKRFTVKPMSVDEAIERMEALGHSFFLFFDADAEEVRLLYRRNDGDYGLIEPEID